jgi:hypothetical protein
VTSTLGRELVSTDLRRGGPAFPVAGFPASAGIVRGLPLILVRDLRGMQRSRRSIAPALATKDADLQVL